MSDPYAVADAWLSDRLEGDAELAQLLPGGIHEGHGFSIHVSPFLVITWGQGRVTPTFQEERFWTLPVIVSVQGVDVPQVDISAGFTRIHTLLRRQPPAAVRDLGRFHGCVRTDVSRTLFESPTTGKRESQATYRITVSPAD